MNNQLSSMTSYRFAAHCLEKLHQLKERVTLELSMRYNGALEERRLRQVIGEADALAATTPFPALFLPTLAEEKVRAAVEWQVRQRQVLDRPLPLAA